MASAQRRALVALQAGALLAGVGMVAQQIVVGSVGNVVFTAVIAVVFVLAVLAMARGQRALLEAEGENAIPEKEPLQMTVVALMVVSVVMWLAGCYAAFWAVRYGGAGNGWLALALVGIAVACTSATWLVRDTRQRWLDRYRRHWFPKD